MIRITKQADYAIILLGHFVSDDPSVSWNARDLAAHTRLPLPMVGKVLKMLARRGLLESHRGVKGGYRLARKPEDIPVIDVISAVEGPIGITSCSAVSGCCEYEPACPARSNWHLINRAVLSALKNISLREMAQPEVVFRKPDRLTRPATAAPAADGSPGASTATDTIGEMTGTAGPAAEKL